MGFSQEIDRIIGVPLGLANVVVQFEQNGEIYTKTVKDMKPKERKPFMWIDKVIMLKPNGKFSTLGTMDEYSRFVHKNSNMKGIPLLKETVDRLKKIKVIKENICLLFEFLSSYMNSNKNYGNGQFTVLNNIPNSKQFLFQDPKLSNENKKRIDEDIKKFMNQFEKYIKQIM
jgi:hypothetical protein